MSVTLLCARERTTHPDLLARLVDLGVEAQPLVRGDSGRQR